ncbi:MAG: NIPSNAP family protein [Chloroflexi bacterium]|nr:NIPSNAP family protein [Chloroflexota bacterium]
MANNPSEFKSVADAYSGYTSQDKVYLTVTVQCTRSGISDFVKHFGNGIEHRRAISESLVPVGAWRTIYGPSNELVHLYAFDSMAEMERLRRKLFTDPRHLEHIKINTSPNPSNNWEVSGQLKLYRPLPYSQLK